MDILSKKDLIETVTKQDEELKRYKRRFQDVVTAHKNLIEEKKALEFSIKILTDANEASAKSNSSPKVLQERNVEDSNVQECNVESIAKSADGKESDSAAELQNQLSMLMKSLSSLSAEKSRMEVCFQTDRKQLRQEKERLLQEMKEMKQRHEVSIKNYQSEIENLKSKLIIEKHQREKEMLDHGAIVRELHRKLHEENKKREELERSGSLKDKREEEILKRLEVAEQNLSKTKVPLLNRLHEEMVAMKQQHQVAIQQEQERAEKAEEKVQKLAAMHEERVANLESRLAELSLTVGSYDHLRQQDQCAISKLKERLMQIESERNDCMKDKVDMDFEALINQLKRLKQLILEANDSAEKPLDVQAILLEGLMDNKLAESNNISRDLSLCQEEYAALKQEFDNYKKQFTFHHRANLFSNAPKNDETGEKTVLQNQIKNLKEKINLLQNDLSNTEQEFKAKLDQQKKAFEAEKKILQEKLSTQEGENKTKIFTLEQQIVKQRERAIALVQEKEQEIFSLKDSMNFIIPTSVPKKERSSSQSSDVKDLSEINSNGTNFLPLSSANESPHMLHYAHELARRDVDISQLRQQKHKLEMTIRDLQRIIAAERDEFSQDILKLKEEVSRLERCKSRESANLEYLKNVVLSYLTTSSNSQRHHMLNAIAFILKFSENETKKALLHINRISAT